MMYDDKHTVSAPGLRTESDPRLPAIARDRAVTGCGEVSAYDKGIGHTDHKRGNLLRRADYHTNRQSTHARYLREFVTTCGSRIDRGDDMRLPTRKLHSPAGFSLVEVLIALVLTGIVTTAVLKLYVTQHESYLAQDDVTTIQQNARASIDELSRQIRMAGHDLPLGMPALKASNTNPDTITIRYHGNNCDVSLGAAQSTPSSALVCGDDVSCFDDGQWAYIFDPDSGYGEWFQIAVVQAGANTLQLGGSALSRSYDSNAVVTALNEFTFFVDNTTDPDHPCMKVKRHGDTPRVYAMDITSLEFTYRLTNGLLVDEPVLAEDVREVIIDVVGRSHIADPDDDDNPYRERAYHSSVNMRNVGL